MAMDHRTIGGLGLAAALLLGACTPTQLGDDVSAEPTQAAESIAPARDSGEPSETPEVTESAEPTPDDYEY